MYSIGLCGLSRVAGESKSLQVQLNFVQDTSPQVYEHLVDRLLASSAFGEQRACYWLDYARYADTYGLHFDNNRYIWAYRDLSSHRLDSVAGASM
jgi:Protein of unknown function (DUF1549)